MDKQFLEDIKAGKHMQDENSSKDAKVLSEQHPIKPLNTAFHLLNEKHKVVNYIQTLDNVLNTVMIHPSISYVMKDGKTVISSKALEDIRSGRHLPNNFRNGSNIRVMLSTIEGLKNQVVQTYGEGTVASDIVSLITKIVRQELG